MAGGLEAEGGSAQGVFAVSLANGTATQVGALAAPLHDSAAVVISGKGYVFGGGTPAATKTAERLPSLGALHGNQIESKAVANRLSPLPQPRADDSALTIGSTAYVVGGYDGSVGDAAVLATTDGRHYATITDLPVPVRYAASVAWHNDIYVFGGDATSGPQQGNQSTPSR